MGAWTAASSPGRSERLATAHRQGGDAAAQVGGRDARAHIGARRHRGDSGSHGGYDHLLPGADAQVSRQCAGALAAAPRVAHAKAPMKTMTVRTIKAIDMPFTEEEELSS